LVFLGAVDVLKVILVAQEHVIPRLDRGIQKKTLKNGFPPSRE
jgi:hypothetical protein